MYELTLTPEQIEFRDTVRDFVTREIKPVATNATRLQRLRPPFPADLLALTEPLGLRLLMLPTGADVETAGAGADTLTACIVLEELAAGDVDVAMAVLHTALLAPWLFGEAMNVEQRTRFLPDYVNGGSSACHLAYAGRAPDGPGWQYHRQRVGAQATRVKAAQQDGHWVLSGDAGFAANADVAGLIVVEAGSSQGAITLLVPRDTPGFTVREVAESSDSVVKWHHGAGAYVSFKQCSVPSDHRLQYTSDIRPWLRRGVALRAAVNLGLGRAAFEAAIDYAKLRVQGARPIIQHQAIGAKLADIAVHLEAARNLIWKAAWSLDHPEADAQNGYTGMPLETAARVFTAEAVRAATENAAECFGAMGVMLDMPLQKYVHDAVIFLHSGVSDTVEKFEIAEAVAGFVPAAA